MGGRLRLSRGGGLWPENREEALDPLACSMEPPPRVSVCGGVAREACWSRGCCNGGSAPGLSWATVPDSMEGQMSRQGVLGKMERYH